jgi:REP element-mobilizing transposase RayT
VTARAPKGLALFRAAADRRRYLALLAAEVSEREWSLRTYCLMGNHIHLLVQTPKPDLGKGMKVIHETYVRLMHRHYQGHGHLFGDRFHNTPVLNSDHEVACLRYIARNPVAAGLCPSPDGWEWSAHRALAGLMTPPAFLDVAAVRATLGIAGYRTLVATPDHLLLDELSAQHPDTWIARAVDDHCLPISSVAKFLNIHLSSAYRHLRTAREKRDSPLIRAGANEGTVP